MSLLKALRRKNKCDECGRTHGVDRVWFGGEFKGYFCKDCRLFGAHIEDA